MAKAGGADILSKLNVQLAGVQTAKMVIINSTREVAPDEYLRFFLHFMFILTSIYDLMLMILFHTSVASGPAILLIT